MVGRYVYVKSDLLVASPDKSGFRLRPSRIEDSADYV